MGVSPIHIHNLASGMSASGRGQKQDRIRNFTGGRHPLFEGDHSFDTFKGSVRIRTRRQPPRIERSHHLCGNHTIDADAERREIERPFAGECVHGSFGGGVTTGTACPVTAHLLPMLITTPRVAARASKAA